MRAKEVVWFGQPAPLGDGSAFALNNKGRYGFFNGLLKYFGFKNNPLLPSPAPVAPKPGLLPVPAYAIRIERAGSRFVVTDEVGARRVVDAVILATGIRNEASRLLSGLPANETLPVLGDVVYEGGHKDLSDGLFKETPLMKTGRTIALQVGREEVYLAGLAAGGERLVSPSEARSGALGDTDEEMQLQTNSKNSLELLLPRTRALAERHAAQSPPFKEP